MSKQKIGLLMLLLMILLSKSSAEPGVWMTYSSDELDQLQILLESGRTQEVFSRASKLIDSGEYHEMPSEQLRLYRFLLISMQRWVSGKIEIKEIISKVDHQRIEEVLELTRILKTDEAFELAVHYVNLGRSLFADKTVGNAPDSLLRLINVLDTKRDLLKNQYNKERNEEAKADLVDLIMEIEERIRDNNERIQPSQRVSDFTSFQLQEAGTFIGQEEAWISYFVGHEYTFALLFSKNQHRVIPLGHSDTIRNYIFEYQKAVESFREKEHFIRCNYQVYQKIMAPLMPYLDDTKRIVVMPDDLIGSVAFDAFHEIRPEDWDRDYASLDYLIHRFQFSLHHSFDLLLTERSKKSPSITNPKLLAVAPVFDKLAKQSAREHSFFDTLPALPETALLVRELETWLNGNFLYQSAATKSNLLTNFSGHDIVHILTHTIVDTSDSFASYMVLAPHDSSAVRMDTLSFRELLEWPDPVKTDLLILSSCQTGRGDFKKGESLSGLAGVFGSFGQLNLIYSLWSVDETATCELFRGYYKQLLSERSKGIALHEAKHKLIDEGFAAPFYWSGFVYFGDTSAYDFDESNFQCDVKWGVIFIFISVLCFFKRKARDI